jgi:hypothetical protein
MARHLLTTNPARGVLLPAASSIGVKANDLRQPVQGAGEFCNRLCPFLILDRQGQRIGAGSADKSGICNARFPTGLIGTGEMP